MFKRGGFKGIVKDSAPKTFEEGKQKAIMEMHVLNKKRGYLFDRSMFGERIYGPIMRGYFPTYMDELDEAVEDHNYLFLITASENVVKQRFDGIFISIDQIPLILKEYYKHYLHSKRKNKYLIDTTYVTPQAAADHVIEVISGNLNGHEGNYRYPQFKQIHDTNIKYECPNCGHAIVLTQRYSKIMHCVPCWNDKRKVAMMIKIG